MKHQTRIVPQTIFIGLLLLILCHHRLGPFQSAKFLEIISMINPLTVTFLGGCRGVLYHDAFFTSVPLTCISINN